MLRCETGHAEQIQAIYLCTLSQSWQCRFRVLEETTSASRQTSLGFHSPQNIRRQQFLHTWMSAFGMRWLQSLKKWLLTTVQQTVTKTKWFSPGAKVKCESWRNCSMVVPKWDVRRRPKACDLQSQTRAMFQIVGAEIRSLVKRNRCGAAATVTWRQFSATLAGPAFSVCSCYFTLYLSLL